jgi:small subunit ribosomal protein S3Ae
MAIVKKLKKKEIVPVVLPQFLGGKEIEVIATDINNLIGKRMILNLIEVLPETNKYYVKLIVKINKVEGNKAFAVFDGLELMRDYVSRMVVRRVRRIDNVQDVITKDGIKIRVKTLITTSRKASSKVEKSIRREVNQMVENSVKNNTLEEFLNGVFYDNFKKEFTKELIKIYPLRNFEFRKIEVMKA